MRLESTIERFIVTTMDTQQVIKEETSMVIPKDRPFSLEDLKPDVSLTQDAKGNIVLKKTQYKIVNLQ